MNFARVEVEFGERSFPLTERILILLTFLEKVRKLKKYIVMKCNPNLGKYFRSTQRIKVGKE